MILRLKEISMLALALRQTHVQKPQKNQLPQITEVNFKHRLKLNPLAGQITECPRCGLMSVENLKLQAHCWECNYFPEEFSDIQSTNQIERNKHNAIL